MVELTTPDRLVDPEETSVFISHLQTAFRGKLTVQNLAPIVLEAMEFAEGYSGLTGPEKKYVVILIVSKALKMADPANEFMWDDMLACILPQLIEAFVGASKTGLNINRSGKSCWNKFVSCLECVVGTFA